MLKLGLTGNIASGKSTVAAAWAALGATVVDADLLARRAVEPGSAALNAIVGRWGREVLAPDGALDRAALRAIVFADPAERAHLEAIVHPAVARLRDEAMREAERRGDRVVVADIPLLFEAGLQDEFDLVVLVDAPDAVRRQRLIELRGLSPEQADRMIAAQIPSGDKRPRADLVINNDGTREQLQRRAADAWHDLMARAARAEATP